MHREINMIVCTREMLDTYRHDDSYLHKALNTQRHAYTYTRRSLAVYVCYTVWLTAQINTHTHTQPSDHQLKHNNTGR